MASFPAHPLSLYIYNVFSRGIGSGLFYYGLSVIRSSCHYLLSEDKYLRDGLTTWCFHVREACWIGRQESIACLVIGFCHDDWCTLVCPFVARPICALIPLVVVRQGHTCALALRSGMAGLIFWRLRADSAFWCDGGGACGACTLAPHSCVV